MKFNEIQLPFSYLSSNNFIFHMEADAISNCSHWIGIFQSALFFIVCTSFSLCFSFRLLIESSFFSLWRIHVKCQKQFHFVAHVKLHRTYDWENQGLRVLMKYMQATQHGFFVETVFSKRHLKNSMHIFSTKTIKNIPMRNCAHFANNLCIFSDFFSKLHNFLLNNTGGTLMNLFGQ